MEERLARATLFILLTHFGFNYQHDLYSIVWLQSVALVKALYLSAAAPKCYT